MKRLFILIFVCLWLPCALQSQSANMSQRISVSFVDTTLEEALRHLSEICQVQFAYSADKIPVQDLVTLEAVQQPLGDVLDELFAPTQIVYARIGEQIVLKIDEKKNEKEIGVGTSDSRLSGREIEYEYPDEIYRAEEMKSDSPLQKETKVVSSRLPKKLPPKAILGDGTYEFKIDYTELDFQGKIKLSNYEIPIIESIRDIDLPEINGPDSLSAHVGVVPKVEKRFGKQKEKDNFSANILIGKSKNIKGMQLSGILNMVEQDMTGTQLACIGNIVEGTAEGVQIGGLFNYSAEDNFGSQISLISNIAETMIGAQVSLLTNQAQSGFTGLQLSGLYNKGIKASSGLQLAGLMNQASGTINAQVGLINKAQEVKGIQIGLINMADTVSGAPIALLNLIKRGYNRVELSYNETFPFNVGIKLGARGFYNIFKTAATSDFGYWGLGYGIGTYLRAGKRAGFNFELSAMHLNQKETWITKANVLGQLRLSFDVRLGQKFSLFVGPDFNIYYTRAFDMETGLFLHQVAPYTFYEEQRIVGTIPYRAQLWIGYSAGLRF